MKEMTFPIRDKVLQGESGQGYVLRMATANGLRGLPFVKACLGRSRFQTLDAADATSVSKWFGASEAELTQALGRLSRKDEGERFSYAGHDMGRSYFVNRGHPRVCSRCLSLNGYCRAEWDFVLAVACPRHACLLHDRCPMCTRALDWNRPSLMSCHCYSDLRMWPSQDGLPSLLETAFARWVSMAVAPLTLDESPVNSAWIEQDGLMRLLRPLSLGAGLSLTYALASSAGRCADGVNQRVRKKASLSQGRQVLVVADQLVQRIADGQRIELQESQRTVTVALLFEAIVKAKCPEDKAIALSILSAVYKKGGRTRWSGRYGQLSQMQLFEPSVSAPPC